MATRTGGAGPDILTGTDAADILRGLGGNDILRGLEGNDQLFGGAGGDTLKGGAGADRLSGTGRAGNNDFAVDTLSAGAGDDHLNGFDASSDILRGGAGRDFLSVNNDNADGGLGDDWLITFHAGGRLTGGAGADLFDLHTESGSSEFTVIADFSTLDHVFVEYNEANFAFGFIGLDLFNRLDTTGDSVLDGADGFTLQPEGVSLGVATDATSLTLFLGEDTIRFDNVGNISIDNWLL